MAEYSRKDSMILHLFVQGIDELTIELCVIGWEIMWFEARRKFPYLERPDKNGTTDFASVHTSFDCKDSVNVDKSIEICTMVFNSRKEAHTFYLLMLSSLPSTITC